MKTTKPLYGEPGFDYSKQVIDWDVIHCALGDYGEKSKHIDVNNMTENERYVRSIIAMAHTYILELND